MPDHTETLMSDDAADRERLERRAGRAGRVPKPIVLGPNVTEISVLIVMGLAFGYCLVRWLL
jgi:hypothetical protein